MLKTSLSLVTVRIKQTKGVFQKSPILSNRKKSMNKYNKQDNMDIEYNNNAQKYKELGNQAYKNQDYNRAISYYTKAIEADPSQPNFFSNRSLCFYNLNKYQQCIQDCDRALLLNPNFVKVLKKKSQAYLNILKFNEAVEAAKQVVTIERSTSANNELQQIESLKSNYDRYIQAQRANNYSQALSCIVHLVNKIPNNATLKLNKVECLAKTGETKQASNLLNTIHNQNTPQFYYLKGIIQLYSGDSAKAKKYFTDGIKLDPQNRKCHTALNKAKKCESYKQEGNQLIKQQKWKQAQIKYTQALNLDPYNKKLNSVIYSNRALTFMKRGLKIKAIEDLNKSLELDPNYMKSLVRRAELNMERQDYSAALNDYSKIQQLDPSVNLKAKIEQARRKEKQAKKKDYYAILGVAKTATQAQIKKAYKTLALKYHPDRNRGKSQVEQEEASKKFKDIAQAHGVLTDADKRKRYDCGQMQYDGDQGTSGFENMNFNAGNKGSNVKFSFNGSDMGGMGGIDPSQIFQMFFNNKGGSSFGGFSGFHGMNGMSEDRTYNKRGSSKAKGFGFFDNGGSSFNFS